jgi:two-component system, chemotaxis family, chemotaxis protein CheY
MKILLIDDSSLSRTMFKRCLGLEHDYIEASEGLLGLEMYQLNKPLMVLLDLTLPGIPGMETLRALKEIDPKACVIIGSADVQEITRKEAEASGAVGFITKPFTKEVVKAEMQRVWGRGELTIDN